jgi:hypothetical protein
MAWLAHHDLPFPNTSLQPLWTVLFFLASQFDLGWGCVAVSLAAGPVVEVKLLRAFVSPEPDLFTFFSFGREQANGIGGSIYRRLQFCCGRVPVHPGLPVQKSPN